MTRATASRQLWSSLRTWERKPQRVVAGPNTRSRYSTPCSSSTSRMLAWVKTSANGRPWSRAKRARTASREVMGDLKCLRCERGGPGKRGGGTGPDKGSTRGNRLPASLYAVGSGHALRPQPHRGLALALMLATFVDGTAAHNTPWAFRTAARSQVGAGLP